MSEIDEFAQGLSEMSGAPEAAPVQAAETPAPQPEQPQEPAQPAPAAEPAPQAQPVLDENTAKALDGRLGAALAERDKRQEWERRAQAAEAEVQRYRQQQQPVQAPSVYDDPEGFAAYQQQQLQQELQQGILAARFEMSEALARTVHGEQVEPAKQWAMEQANRVPGFADQYISQANPIDWAVRQHRQHQLLAKMGDVSDLDKWIEEQASARGFVKAGAAPAAPPSPTAPAQPAPSRSIASQPSAGGPQTIPTGPLASLEAVFPGN